MNIDNWDEIRTAFQVAKLGTVSGAAQELGVHHATVIRHIDSLEGRLGVKLFQRHARGYTPTEAGADLLKVAQATDDQFGQLISRIKGRGEAVTGELVVTSLPGMSHFLVPILADFQQEHSGLTVRYLTGERLFRLEYGEAHVAIRAGRPPQEPDNVVQKFLVQKTGLYIHRSYIERYGPFDENEPLKTLNFIGHDDPNSRAPFAAWLRANVSPNQIIFRALETDAMYEAVLCGAGAGFLPKFLADARDDLIEVMPSLTEWDSLSWLVTHVDLHRTPKVQAFLNYLKSRAKEWEFV